MRQLQHHPWITDPYEDDDDGVHAEDIPDKPATDIKLLVEWQDDAENGSRWPPLESMILNDTSKIEAMSTIV